MTAADSWRVAAASPALGVALAPESLFPSVLAATLTVCVAQYPILRAYCLSMTFRPLTMLLVLSRRPLSYTPRSPPSPSCSPRVVSPPQACAIFLVAVACVVLLVRSCDPLWPARPRANSQPQARTQSTGRQGTRAAELSAAGESRWLLAMIKVRARLCFCFFVIVFLGETILAHCHAQRLSRANSSISEHSIGDSQYALLDRPLFHAHRLLAAHWRIDSVTLHWNLTMHRLEIKQQDRTFVMDPPPTRAVFVRAACPCLRPTRAPLRVPSAPRPGALRSDGSPPRLGHTRCRMGQHDECAGGSSRQHREEVAGENAIAVWRRREGGRVLEWEGRGSAKA